MRVVASERATDLIESRGGRLYVWVKRGRCCGASSLRASTEAPRGREFRRVDGDEPFDLFVPAQLPRLPDVLELDVSRFPERVEAYWDGCAWIV
jgi:hypothetical protein